MDSTISGQERHQGALDVFNECLQIFGQHAIESKIPSIVDGLKPVQRRILLVSKEYVNHTPLPKVVTITGKTIGLYHPHADASISDAAIRMAQPRANLVTLMDSPSNTGDYGGGNPAAPRYFEIQLSKYSIFCFFDGIDFKQFPHVQSEIGNGEMEPVYFVPRLPTALVNSCMGIGFGHSSEPGNLNLIKVVEMVKRYAKSKQKEGIGFSETIFRSKVAEACIPDFPTYQYIRNWDELIQGNKKGEYTTPLILEGRMEVYPNKIIVTNLPPNSTPKDVWEMAGKEQLASKPNLWNTHFSQIVEYSKGQETCHLEFTLKRGVDPFQILDTFKEEIGFTKRWAPRYLFTTPEGYATYSDPLQILYHWYDMRINCLLGEIRSKQNKLTRDLRLVDALLIIGKDIHKVVQLLIASPDQDAALKALCTQYPLNKNQAMAVMSYPLGNLPKKSRAENLEKQKKLLDEMTKLNAEYLNPHRIIEEDAEKAIKQFSQYKNRISGPCSFIGYVQLPTGIIHFENIEEALQITDTFPEFVNIIFYSEKRLQNPYTINYKKTDSCITLPKQMAYNEFVKVLEYTHTIVWSSTGRVGRLKGLCSPTNTSINFCFVASEFIVVDTNKVIRKATAEEIVLTKSAERPSGNGIQFVSHEEITDTRMWVAVSSTVNEIEILQTSLGETLPITNKTTILAIGSILQPLSIPIPTRCTDKCTIKQVVLITPKTMKIKLNLRKSSHPFYLHGNVILVK